MLRAFCCGCPRNTTDDAGFPGTRAEIKLISCPDERLFAELSGKRAYSLQLHNDTRRGCYYLSPRVSFRFMYLMYVDESGDTGLEASPTEFFALSGIVIHESRWRDFINQLIAFRKTLRGAYGLPIRSEIHASYYINHRPVELDRHIRLAILRNMLDELASLDYISITNVVVRKAGKPSDYDVFENAWRTLFQRFENTMRFGNFPGEFRDDKGFVITDATAGKKLSRLVRKMAVYNFVPNDSRHGMGARNLPITRIIEDPYGKDSAETLPIQAADVVAYFLQQRYKPGAYVKKQRARLYFDRLDRVLNKHASRYNNLGVVEL